MMAANTGAFYSGHVQIELVPILGADLRPAMTQTREQVTLRSQLLVLRQIVGDGEPGRLRADMDMRGRVQAGSVGEGAVRHMHAGAIAHHRIEQRAAVLAEGVVNVGRAVDRKTLRAFGEGELVALDAAERLEGRSGRAPALRAVAVHGVAELVAYLVLHRAAQAAAGKNTVFLRQVAPPSTMIR